MASSQNRGYAVFLFFNILCFIVLQIFSNSNQVLASPAIFACDALNNPEVMSYKFCNSSLDVKTRVHDLVKRMALSEKISNLGDAAKGVVRLGVPKYEFWSEALHGVSNVGPGTRFSSLIPGATSFPQVICTAASFNVSLFEAIGKVVSTEARAMYNVGLALLTFWSPNINIFRDPRWGRGQETPGEDPLLASEYGVSYVKGLQGTDGKNRLKVAACCKHYTAYDLDNWKGIDRYLFNAKVTMQDLVDTFQPPFKSCVTDGNVASVMCSYNQVNGVPTCADPRLLSGIVRRKWRLHGYISTDCDSLDVMFNAQNYTKTPQGTAALALKAGVDLNCGDFLQKYTETAVNEGLVKKAEVNRAVTNNFATLMRLGFFDGNPSNHPYGRLGPGDVCTPANQELARDAARQGIVLLKNIRRSLPLSSIAIKSLAVIGPNANVTATMIGNYAGIPCKYTTPLEGLTAFVPTLYEPGCDNVTCDIAQLYDAKKIASTADATVLIVGLDLSVEAEARDRIDLTLPGQQTILVKEVAKASKGPVILVIMSGGGVDVAYAKHDPKVASILWVGYPGEAGGAAIADIVFGLYNPSGRLPMTWYPQSFVEKVSMTNMNMRPNSRTGYPGRTYRFYKGPTLYSFGYGLSYSKFSHKVVNVPKVVLVPLEEGHACKTSNCIAIDVVEQNCKNAAFEVHMKVKNEGNMSGSHTVLLFWNPPQMYNAPQKHLLGFDKVHLTPQEQRLVKFNLNVCKHLSLVDELGNRKVALGLHVLHIGNSKHSITVKI